jgi:hypothetical protein
MAKESMTALAWGINYLRTKGWEDGYYSKTWAEDAEADGLYVWVFEFLGSNAEWARISTWSAMLDSMFGREHFMIEIGEDLVRIVFDSVGDAVMFRFAVADKTA